MDDPSVIYDDVVAVYIAVIKQDSPQAAAAVEQILSLCGSRAALRATLILTLLKVEVQDKHTTTEAYDQVYMLHDYPAALPLLALAMQYWLRDRAIRDEGIARELLANSLGAKADSALSNPDLMPDLED